jgi:hypothetical protein
LHPAAEPDPAETVEPRLPEPPICALDVAKCELVPRAEVIALLVIVNAGAGLSAR